MFVFLFFYRFESFFYLLGDQQASLGSFCGNIIAVFVSNAVYYYTQIRIEKILISVLIHFVAKSPLDEYTFDKRK